MLEGKARAWLPLCVAALVVVATVACTGTPPLRGADGKFAPIDGANVLARGARVVNPGVTHDELVALADANAAFALDVYRHMAAAGEGNILIGPQSISTALAMIYPGARGQTAADMARVLHFDDIPNVPARFNALDFALLSRQQAGAVDLRLANQVFAQPGFPLVESYLETLSAQFGAPLAELDFGESERARGVINDWAAQQTNDRIQELFPSGAIDGSTRLVLVNAVSFDAAWRYIFDPAATRPGGFERADGSVATVPMMHFDVRLPVAFETDYRAVELMYGRGDLSMVLILPDDLAEFESTLSTETLGAIFDRISDSGVHFLMPKFSFSHHTDMDPILTALGMGSAYEGADFSGIVEGGGLFVQAVEHEAFIEVDEAGTEAHAASGVAMAVSHGPTIELNRPFFFVIRDRITGAILFLGRVADPSVSD